MENMKRILKQYPSSFDVADSIKLLSNEQREKIKSKLMTSSVEEFSTRMEKIRVWNLLSYFCFILGDREGASHYNCMALEISPDSIIALSNKAWFSLEERKNFKICEDICERLKCLKTDKMGNLVANAEIAFTYSKLDMKFYDKAVSEFKKVIEEFENEKAVPLSTSVVGSNGTETWTEYFCVWMFRCALTMNRLSNVQHMHDFCPTEQIKENYKCVVKLFSRIIGFSADQSECIQRYKARSYIGMGLIAYDVERKSSVFPGGMACLLPAQSTLILPSREYFTKALEIFPDDVFVLERSGKYFRYFKEVPMSIDLLNRAIKIKETSFGHHHLALSYIRLLELNDSELAHRSLSIEGNMHSDSFQNIATLDRDKIATRLPERNTSMHRDMFTVVQHTSEKQVNQDIHAAVKGHSSEKGAQIKRNEPLVKKEGDQNVDSSYRCSAFQAQIHTDWKIKPSCVSSSTLNPEAKYFIPRIKNNLAESKSFAASHHTEQDLSLVVHNSNSTEFRSREIYNRTHTNRSDRGSYNCRGDIYINSYNVHNQTRLQFDPGETYRHTTRRGRGSYYHHGDRDVNCYNNYNQTRLQFDPGETYRHTTRRGRGSYYHHGDRDVNCYNKYNQTRLQFDPGETYRHTNRRGRGSYYHHGDRDVNCYNNYNQTRLQFDPGETYRPTTRRGRGFSYRKDKYGIKCPRYPIYINYKENKDVVDEIDSHLDLAAKLSTNRDALYEKALLYRKMEQFQTALDILQSLMQSQGEIISQVLLAGIYEQAAYCMIDILNQAETEDHNKMEELKCDRDVYLKSSLEISCNLEAIIPELRGNWKSGTTLIHILLDKTKTKRNKQTLQDLWFIYDKVNAHFEAIGVLREMQELAEDDTEKKEIIVNLVKQHLCLCNYEEAVTALCMAQQLTDGFASVEKSLYLQVYIDAGLDAFRKKDFEKARLRIRKAFELQCQGTTKDEDCFELFILSNIDGDENGRKLATFLSELGLKTTFNSDSSSVIPGSPEIQGITEVIDKSAAFAILIDFDIKNKTMQHITERMQKILERRASESLIVVITSPDTTVPPASTYSTYRQIYMDIASLSEKENLLENEIILKSIKTLLMDVAMQNASK